MSGIQEMAFQQEPGRLVWACLEDGSLVCMTYERAQEVVGWHRHPIPGTAAAVESVAVIPHPDGDADQLWLIVARTINGGTKRYVEYMEKEWRDTNDIEDAKYSDSGLTYDGTPLTNFVWLHHLEGETVTVLEDGVPMTDKVVSGGSIAMDGDDGGTPNVVQVGLAYDATLQTMRIEAGAAEGTAQGRTKRITDAVLRLWQTGEGLKFGPDDDESTMDEYRLTSGQLTDGDTDPALPWPAGYEQAGRLTLKHTKPLPCTITAILPTVVTQGG